MLSLSEPTVYQSSKCFTTYGTMGYPDPKQLPSKGKPWSVLLAQDFIHKVDAIVPAESVDKLKEKLNDDRFAPKYSRVIMTLGDALNGQFFTQYIKIGNVRMLSECKIGVTNVFTLKNGLLKMYLDKETYERAGLVGQPHGVKGKRGLKPRWVVEYDLRSPASFPGKKGFDRLMYACKNVFNQPLAWLFLNLSQTPDPDPLADFAPVKYTSSPTVTGDCHTLIPVITPPQSSLCKGGKLDLEEFATDMYEWLSLVRLDSPRITAGDTIDPYLSRYSVPNYQDDPKPATLCKVSWQGFIDPNWTRQLLVDLILSTSSRSWFAMSTSSFEKGAAGKGSDCMILRPANSPGEYVMWDVHGHE
ncbi:hypothetical protein PG999_012722 [Apiospora kogelbergensis]|uniref:Uncharacterized protein n=1 Tax=Apiospora kogelbergensis TaxID=1337665 RepID=A0AAW0Q7V2_9PEZI